MSGVEGMRRSVLHLCYSETDEVKNLQLSDFRRVASSLRADLALSEARQELGDQPRLGGLSGSGGHDALAAEARRQSLVASGVVTEDEKFWRKRADTAGWK